MADHSSTVREHPQEVVDMILDHLFNHKEELAVCSLVCKAWLPTTRYHLLANIVVTVKVHRTRATADTVFFEILDSPYCTIRQYIRHIQLRGPCGSHDQRCITNISWLHSLLAIQSLHIDNIDWENFGNEWKATLFHHFFRLESLSLSRTSFRSFSDILDTIHVCPRLKSLSISDEFAWTQYSSPASIASRPLPGLQNLTLAGASKIFLLRSLYTPVMHLNTLDLQSITSEQRPLIDRVLIATASTLESLTLSFAKPGQVQAAHGLSLSRCINLRALCFSRAAMYMEYSADDPVRVVREMLNILSSVRARGIEDVTFRLWLLNSVDELEAFDWAAADESFRLSEFSRMRKVRFELHGVSKSESSSAVDWIRKRMPECFARGILELECTLT